MALEDYLNPCRKDVVGQAACFFDRIHCNSKVLPFSEVLFDAHSNFSPELFMITKVFFYTHGCKDRQFLAAHQMVPYLCSNLVALECQ